MHTGECPTMNDKSVREHTIYCNNCQISNHGISYEGITNTTELINIVNDVTRRKVDGNVLADFLYEDLRLSPGPICEVSPQMARVNVRDYYKGRCIHLTQDIDCRYQQGGEIEFLTRDSLMASILPNATAESKKQIDVTAIVASMGSGKTTLMRNIAHTALMMTTTANVGGNTRVQHNMVHYIDLADIKHEIFTKPSQFLFGGLYSSDTKSDRAYEWLVENQHKAILLFDGLDQIKWDFDEIDQRGIGEFESASTATIMHNILCRKILHKVKVVISSREFKVLELPSKARPRDVIVLGGLRLADAERLFSCITWGSRVEHWQNLSLLPPLVFRLISNPLCLVVAAVVMISDRTPPTTAAQFYNMMISALQGVENIRNTLKFVSVINKLKPMAFQGVHDGKDEFNKMELQQFGVIPEEVYDIMMAVPANHLISYRLMKDEFKFRFYHQGIQEFLAASFVAEMDLNDFSAFYDRNLHVKWWSSVLTLAAGILFSESPFNICKVHDQTEKQEVIAKSIRVHLEGDIDNDEWMRMSIYKAIYESNSEELLKHLHNIDVSNIPLKCEEAHIVGNLAGRSAGLEYLNLQSCQIDDELMNILVWRLICRRVQVDNLDLRNNPISASALRPLTRDIYLGWKVFMLNAPLDYVSLSNQEELIIIRGISFKGSFDKQDKKLTIDTGSTLALVVYLGILFEPDVIQIPDHCFNAKQEDLRGASKINMPKMRMVWLDCIGDSNIDWSIIEAFVRKHNVEIVEVAVNSLTFVDECSVDAFSERGVTVNIHRTYEFRRPGRTQNLADLAERKTFGTYATTIQFVRCILYYRASFEDILNIVERCNSTRVALVYRVAYDMLTDEELREIQTRASHHDCAVTALIEQDIPSDTATAYVRQSTRVIKVGGCSVRFESNSFEDDRQITIRAEINPRKYPEGFEAIAPTLIIEAPDLRVPATVKVHTWCICNDSEEEIDIMHFNEGNMKWEKIDSCIMGDDGIITFKRSHFCRLGVFRPNTDDTIARSYKIKPVIWYRGTNYTLSLIPDEPLLKRKLSKLFHKNHKVEGHVFRMQVQHCSRDEDITLSISCKVPYDGTFIPSVNLSNSVNKILDRQTEPTYQSYNLIGVEPDSNQMSMEVECNRKKNEVVESNRIEAFTPIKENAPNPFCCLM